MRLLGKVSLTACQVYALTIVHHVYGAVVFDTPWRHHAAVGGLVALAATLACAWCAVHLDTVAGRRSARKLLLTLTLVVAVGAVGLFEGGYNHVLKNMLFIGGAPPVLMQVPFPPPTYEMPRDVLFEASGMLQLFAGLVALQTCAAFWRTSRQLGDFDVRVPRSRLE